MSKVCENEKLERIVEYQPSVNVARNRFMVARARLSLSDVISREE